MDIQVRTDYHVNGDATLTDFVKDEVAAGLEPFLARITSAQVHLTEESGARKGPHDLVCMIEVRPTGHAPVVVKRHAATKDDVVRSAVDGMRVVLERLFGRLDDDRHVGAETIRRRTS
jgi:hypothetical protein